MRGPLLALLCAVPALAAWPNGYQYRRPISIGVGQAPRALSNLPVLFSQTDAAWTAGAGKIKHTVVTGGATCPADFIFTSDSSGTSVLPFECEEYNAATGTVIYWVDWPSAVSGATIYLFYGNSLVTAFQSVPTSVWDSHFKGVWHLSNGSTLTAQDSTTNGNNGTITGATAASGQIGGAASFVGGNYADKIAVGGGADTSLDMGGAQPVTFSAWIKPTSIFPWWAFPRIYGSAHILGVQVSVPNGLSYSNDAMSSSAYSDANAISTGVWQHVAVTFDGASAVTFYVNGAPAGTPTLNSYTWGDSGAVQYIGNRSDGACPFDGLIDEVQVSNIARSADWIAAEYANQMASSAFLTVGTEQASSATTRGQAIVW